MEPLPITVAVHEVSGDIVTKCDVIYGRMSDRTDTAMDECIDNWVNNYKYADSDVNITHLAVITCGDDTCAIDITYPDGDTNNARIHCIDDIGLVSWRDLRTAVDINGIIVNRIGADEVVS